LKRYLLLLVVVYVAFITGCATTDDVRRVRGKLEWDMRAIKEENTGVRKDMDNVNESMTSLRKTLADLNADLTEVKGNIQTIKGEQEVLRKEVSSSTAKDKVSDDIRKKIDNMSSRLNHIENVLKIRKSEGQPEAAEKEVRSDSKDVSTGKADKDSLYAKAYETFKEGKYNKARADFQNFLKQFPNTEYSERAQFWIGECFYFEKKYEEAILEYEKVVKNYPKGNKISSALLKQGLSFLMLGDKSSAKLILRQVIKNYPNTSQARIAKAKLAGIK
jgi:tol-pal system protein YbgF